MDEQEQLAARVAEAAQERGAYVAVAESLTGGMVACRLSAAPAASQWFRGGIVAYARGVKHDLLAVPDGPVVSRPAAEAMATTSAKLLGATVVVSLTGSGGPDPQDEQSPGTVWFGFFRDGEVTSQQRRFDGGDPSLICEQACTEALQCTIMLLEQR